MSFKQKNLLGGKLRLRGLFVKKVELENWQENSKNQ
jgi:hypothetical protein